MKVSEVATFFGPEASPLFGVLHMPEDRQIRGGVVICGSLGREGMLGGRLERILADDLAGRGFAVLRFDYLGTGDSAFLQNRDDAVANWGSSIEHALDYLTEMGAWSITAIAYRAGCLILADVLGRSRRIDRVVYVDPVGTGRRYLREQTTLFTLSVGADVAPPGTVSIIGARMSAAAAKEFRALSLDLGSAGVIDHLLVLRPGELDPKVSAVSERDGMQSLTADGLPEFAQSAQTVTLLPLEAVDSVINWVDAAAPTARSAATPRYIAATKIPAAEPSGDSVVECIESIGPDGLFAIRTRPENMVPGEGRVVVFYTSANDPHVGPAREWVELSRTIAESGAQAVRWDRSGVGQSGPVSRRQWLPIYTQHDAHDAALVAEYAASDPRNVLVAGPCSGSWYAAQAARAVGTGSALLINPRVWSWPIGATHYWQRNLRTSLHTGESPPSPFGEVRRFVKRAIGYILRKLQSAGRKYSPRFVLRLLGNLGLVQVPEVMLAALADSGSNTTVLLSPWDTDLFASRDGYSALQRLNRVALPPRLVTTEAGDHALYHQAMLEAIRQVVLESINQPRQDHAAARYLPGDANVV